MCALLLDAAGRNEEPSKSHLPDIYVSAKVYLFAVSYPRQAVHIVLQTARIYSGSNKSELQ